MLLALDIGNTNITAGLFEGRNLRRQWRIVSDVRLSHGRLCRQLVNGAGVMKNQVRSAIYGSVVPALNLTLDKAIRQGFGCRALVVTSRLQLGMRILVRRPGQVGSDRLLNALAAFDRVKGPAIVIDFGTATTFDCVSKEGDYLGGAIFPGPKIAAEALFEKTAQLPFVEVQRPKSVIGRDTIGCIESGLYFGYLGMIEKVLKLTLKEMARSGQGRGIQILATGGLANLFRQDFPRRVHLVADLTLDGLSIAFGRLRGTEQSC